jgi:large subunit ribosomal protein L22
MANHNDRKARHKAENDARRAIEFPAHHRFARMAGTKVRLVADQIRGLPINKALETLKFSKKRGAAMLNKVVKSALANAEYQISELKLEIEVDNLYVADVHADEGPTLKRWMTRSRGMAYPILRRMCHIHVTLKAKPGEGEADEKAGAAKAAKEAPGGKTAGKKAGKKAMAGAK